MPIVIYPREITEVPVPVTEGGTGASTAAGARTNLGITAGITNSAPNNTITKSDGTNLVASQITDDGTDIVVASGGSVVVQGNTAASMFSSTRAAFHATSGVAVIGDFQGDGHGTTLEVNDSAQTVTVVGSGAQFIADTIVANVAINAPNLGSVLSVLSANATLATATGTTYSSPGYGGTPLAATSEATVGWVCPRPGTISRLYVITGSVAKVNTPTTTITIRQNGVNTAVTLILTQTTATVSSDLANSFAVAAGDIITLSFTTGGVIATSTSIAGVSFVLD